MSTNTESEANKVKLVLLGAASVGKTSLDIFSRYNESTIGAAFLSHTEKLPNGETISYDIWDTAGQERYESIAPMYYRGSTAAIIVYDITHKQSFQRAKKWVKTLKRDLGNIIILLAANKCDLEDKRMVKKEVAEKYCEEQELIFYETSAKMGTNVKIIFQEIGQRIFDKIQKNKGEEFNPLLTNSISLVKPEKSERKCKGCTFIHS